MIRRIMLFCMVASSCATLLAQARVDTAAQQNIPKEKQTILGAYVTAEEAYARWRSAPGHYTILDVRTPEEVLFVGHPTMAWNIPAFVQSYSWDTVTHRFPMEPNPDFLARVMAVVGPEDTLLVMCRSGGRSAMAVNILAKAGYKHVYNIIDGMEGDTVVDPASPSYGQHLVNGWKNSGLPWTYVPDAERMAIPVKR